MCCETRALGSTVTLARGECFHLPPKGSAGDFPVRATKYKREENYNWFKLDLPRMCLNDFTPAESSSKAFTSISRGINTHLCALPALISHNLDSLSYLCSQPSLPFLPPSCSSYSCSLHFISTFSHLCFLQSAAPTGGAAPARWSQTFPPRLGVVGFCSSASLTAPANTCVRTLMITRIKFPKIDPLDIMSDEVSAGLTVI